MTVYEDEIFRIKEANLFSFQKQFCKRFDKVFRSSPQIDKLVLAGFNASIGRCPSSWECVLGRPGAVKFNYKDLPPLASSQNTAFASPTPCSSY
ncbi:hypothetical protein ElyMa_006546300 [Elysia marginata]|uniref:Uncharacterized protein n=1 Tax=Elysia marginata TaxID=1093978 RepID=A0AAV4I7X6_9GAST|nr:hypothetical protein ElyMa_006546300 [Elysia marginata]